MLQSYSLSSLMINTILINTISPNFLPRRLELVEAGGCELVSGLINRCRMEYHLILPTSHSPGGIIETTNSTSLHESDGFNI